MSIGSVSSHVPVHQPSGGRPTAAPPAPPPAAKGEPAGKGLLNIKV